MNGSSSRSRILTLVFTDLVDSTALKSRHGDLLAGELIARHRRLVTELAAAAGRIVDWAGDGCFLIFDTPSSAVAFALGLQNAHSLDRQLPAVRTGIHMGEVSERSGPGSDGGALRVEGLAVDLAARICALALPGQVLMSTAVADSARQHLAAEDFPRPVVWLSHGSFALKGFDEVLQIREAGLEGLAPLATPAPGQKATPVSAAAPTSKPRWRLALVTLLVLSLGIALVWRFFPQQGSEPGTTPSPVVTSKSSSELPGIPGFGDRPAIAVLPFDNLSGDPEQAYFADGLAEDLITRLSLFRSFPVIARNSSFTYKGKAIDIKTVSADLGVRYVVEGSVRRAGNTVRIAAQLIDASTGEHVWAETYDREITDVFAVQDEISMAIAASMMGDLQRAEQMHAARREPQSLEAWGLYQRALPVLYRFTKEDNAEARRLLERSVILDPQFVPALTRLAETRVWDVAFGWTDAPQATIDIALAEARRAVALDPRAPFAHTILAFALAYLGSIDEAAEEARIAMELNPSDPLVLQYAAYLFVMAGQPPAESIAIMEQGVRLSPNDPLEFLYYDTFGIAYFCAGDYAKGIAASRRLNALRPTYLLGYLYGAMNAAELGEMDAAREFLAGARNLRPDISFAEARQSLGGMAPDVDRRMSAALRKAGLE